MATLDGFNSFIRDSMQISVDLLPDSSPFIETAYTLSIETVNDIIASVSPTMYDTAVYNLAADTLLNIAPDQPTYSFFKDVRAKFDCIGFVSGVITSASDAGTSQSMVTPEQFTGLTLSDLQNLKTPYGRVYLSIAQKYGNIFAVS